MEEFRIVLADACKIVKESSRKRVISGADEDGRVMVEFSEPVGGRRVKMLTPDEINGMLYKEETSESPANAEEAMAEETEPPTAGQEESGESALERIPKDAQTGEPQYTQTDAPTAWDAIVEQTEGDEDMARSVVDSTVRDKEAALKKLESSNPKPGATVAEKIAAAKEHKAAIEAARQELEQWKAIAEVENSRKAEAEAKAKAEEEEAKARAKAEEEEKTDESAERYPVGLDEEESSALMERMEAEAAEIPLIELNPANWVKEFGEKGIVSTPIGEVKMGENQYFKLAQRGRDGKLGMVKPTLETPDVIVEDSSKAKENGAEERPSSYVFVKTFTKADGSRYYHFTSVTVSKDGGEVVVSNQEKSENRISRLLRNGRIVWIDAAFSLHPTAQDRVSVPLGDSNRLTPTDSQSDLLGVSSPEHSAGKDTEQNSDMQAEGGENASALSLIPKDANGEPVYTAADAYTAWDALVEQCGGGDGMAQGVADSMVKDMETALKKAEKSAPAHGVTVAEKIAAAKGHKAAVEKARTELEKWRAIAGETASRARAAEEAERRRKKERLDAAREELRRNGRYAKEDAALGDYTDFADYAMRTIATGKYRFLWGDRESGMQGLGAHLGLTGSRTERNKRIWLLSKDGFTPEEAAERMLADYSAAAGFDSVGDTGVDSMEALDVILDVLRRYTSPRAMMDDAKAAHAENGESAEERRQGEEYERGQFMEAYHMTPEEYYEYENEWLPRYMEEAAQVPQEVIDNINAEYAEKYSENGKDDYNGGEDARGVPPVQGERLDKPGGDEGGGDTGGAAGAVGEGDAAGGFVPQGASGREVRAGEVPQPVGKGAFGDIYDQFRGDAKAAFDFLTKHRSGDLLGVFHRDDTGDIDLVWGDENSGLSHILTKHVGKGKDFGTEQAAFDKIESILKNGKLIQDGRLRYVVSEDGYRVAIRKDYDGVKKNWIVTAVDYNRSKEEKEITTNPTSASHGANGPELAAPNNSKGKVTEESADLQENGGKDAGGKAEMPLSEQIDAASAEVNTEPTEAQKEAGNYKKGHVQVGAFDITIEQPEGSIRRGTDADGKQWESKMHNTYGYFRGTEGVDGDHIDVFLSNDMDGWNGRKVYVVDQYNPDGSFDEHKVMLGFNDASDAKNNYLANYEKGWENGRRIDVSAVSLADFEKWIASSHRKTKPFSEYKSVKPADDSETFKGHKVENSGKDIEVQIKHLEEIKDYPGADKKIVQSEIDRLKAKEEAKAKSKSEEVKSKSKEENGVDDAKIDAVLEALDKGKEKAARRLASELTNKELSKARSKAKPSFLLEYEWQWRAQNRGDVSLHDWMLENQYVEPVKRVSGTFRITDYTAPKDSPYAERLGGVFHDNSGFAVATDARILAASKDDFDPKLKGKVIGKDGTVSESKFPDWQKVIPLAKETKSSNIDVEDLRKFVAGVLRANKRAYISLRFPDGTVEVFKANRLNLMLRAMKQLGTSELLYTKNGMKLVAKSEKGTALLMGLVSVEDELVEANGYAYPGNTVSTGKVSESPETKQEKKEKSEEDRQNKIIDVGEKISGARKDLLRDVSNKLKETTLESLITLPFSKAFKRPDLKTAVEQGLLRQRDARFAEAVMATYLSKNKPRLLSGWKKGESQKNFEAWAKDAYFGVQTLRALFEADETTRDKLIDEILSVKAYREDDIDRRKKQLEEWNPGKKFEGKCYPLNPVAVYMAVYERLGYDNIGEFKLPVSGVGSSTFFDHYELTDNSGKKIYPTRALQSFEDVVDEITYLSKVKNADEDTDHPSSIFRLAGINPVWESTGWQVLTLGTSSSKRPEKHLFKTKEEAEKFAEEYKAGGKYRQASTLIENKEFIGYGNYELKFHLGEKDISTGLTFSSKKDARAAIDTEHEKLNAIVNEKLAKARESGGKNEMRPQKDYVRIQAYTEDGKAWKYAVVLDERYAPKSTAFNTLPYSLANGFSTRKEAVAYIEKHRAEWDAKIDDINRRRKDFVFLNGSSERVGEDYRKGEDITAEQFREQFGFRGVQFGNWTNQKDRQAALNNAFDSFMDLAKILGISPKAVSLNGELGIAFGARGGGGAKAHYEREEVVINLTKTMGAGSLAHEWWHALDNYFARRGNVKLGMVTEGKGIAMRGELRKAYDKLVSDTENSDYNRRSRDAGASYWGTRREETARMFVMWVFDEISKKGERNSFLTDNDPAAEERYAKGNYDFYVLMCGQDRPL